MDTVLNPLYIGVSWIIVQFHHLFSLVFPEDSGWAWGLSIVALVVVIRIALIPLFVKQIKATRNMQILQPKMKAIQERYKNDKQRQSEEMMKLYKDTGTNPLSSCLPILAQSPFFIALFRVLSKVASNHEVGVLTQTQVEQMRAAHIFGAPIAAKFMDSAAKVEELGSSLTDVRIVTAVMIVLMSASQFFTQRQLMTKNVDLTVKTPFMQQQKLLMYVFPIMFAVFGINFPVGVLVYWLTTNVWTMGQQMYVIERNPTPGSKAQAKMLGKLQTTVLRHEKTSTRREKAIVRGIAAKNSRDRNDAERKFVNGLNLAGLVALEDGTVEKGEVKPEATIVEGGTTRRQQPKRQTKAQRQAAAKQDAETTDAADAAGDSSPEPEDAKPSMQKKPQPASGQGGQGGRSRATGNPRSAGSGKRKGGGQRPKHPSSKK
ncbi:Membrane protein insertase YidC [Streptomyces sp. RB5]|uniref:Membrane protein insertase YidC n=1 Tax=Streptomyces smaragdinus TaxID=2585196 RepID=A0A7K0CGR1_9ACTN|nr:membrane protein insertase YidC [Streptomyces smaragdinus]MQY12670.1 Membrane protein insertase YidC [Streptomyces smaragdinus]